MEYVIGIIIGLLLGIVVGFIVNRYLLTAANKQMVDAAKAESLLYAKEAELKAERQEHNLI